MEEPKLPDHFERIKALLAESEPDMEKVFLKGRHSAGIRLRANLQKIKAICQELRILSLNHKNDGQA